MLKILVVEDEYYEREELKRQLTDEYENSNIFTASRGTDAISIIKKEIPDLVLLDIMLSNSSGFEVADFIKKEYPSIKIIIITAYNEFDFALMALNMGIDSYLLKPVRPLLLSQTIKEILNNKHGIGNELKLFYPYLEVGNVDNIKGSLPFCPNIIGVTSLINNNAINIRSKIVNLINLSIEEVGWLEISDHWIIVYLKLEEGINVIDFFEKIIEDCNILTSCKLTFGVGSQVFDINKIVNSYKEAFTAYKGSMFLKNNKVALIHDYKNIITSPNDYPFELERNLLSLIGNGADLKCKRKTMEITNYFVRNCGNDYIILEKWVKNLFYAINRYCEQKSCNEIGIMECCQITSGDQLYNEVKAVVENALINLELCNIIDNPIILKARNIINSRFDEDLTLKSLSDELFINHIYLSRLFKDEVGQGFKDYLIKVRMEAAKEMLLNGSRSISDIANDVGYKSLNYFSKSFKDYYGKSPQTYQREL